MQQQECKQKHNIMYSGGGDDVTQALSRQSQIITSSTSQSRPPAASF